MLEEKEEEGKIKLKMFRKDGGKKKKKLNFAKIVKKIEAKISIPDLITLEHNRAECPQHGNPTSGVPSFEYYESTNSWFCHKCNIGGGVLQLHAILNKITFTDSLFQLANQFKIPIKEESKKEVELREKIYNLWQTFSEMCYRNLLDSKYYNFVMEKRGFIKETIKEFKIGYFNKSIRNYFNEKYSKSLLFNAGFTNDKNHWAFEERIVYPYKNISNQIRYFIFRLIDSSPDFNKAKYVKLATKNRIITNQLLGLNSIVKFKDKPLIITEGITDCISVIQAQYPCLSPVTIRFSEKDFKHVLQYCKRFIEIIIINDTEENNAGLEGALDSIKFLFKNGVNVFLCQIPNPNNLDKIDLDDYLKQGNTIEKQTELLETLIKEKIPAADYFLNKIDEDYKKLTSRQEKSNFINNEVKELFSLVPESDTALLEILKEECSKKLKISKKLINDLIKSAKSDKSKKKKERKVDPNNLIIPYDRSDIVQTNTNIVLRTYRDVGGNEIIDDMEILNGMLKLILKTKDINLGNIERFSFKFNKDNYYVKTVKEILLILDPYIYRGSLGRDVIKKYITEVSKTIEYRKPWYICGFDKKWKIPQTEKQHKRILISQTKFQTDAYEALKKSIKKYTEEEKIQILKELNRLYNITQINKVKLSILIGWTLASPFRGEFINFFKVFPILVLYGKYTTGKTSSIDFWTLDMFKIWKEHLSPSHLDSVARIEDYLSTTTFPIFISEIHKIDPKIIAIFKDHATSDSDYIRKKNVTEVMVQRPKVAPIVLDGNFLPSSFKSEAMNTKMIAINMTDNIKLDPEWLDLYRKIKKYKLFSFIYDMTKDWTREKLIEQFIEIRNNAFKLSNAEKYARLTPIFSTIKFGKMLAKYIFGIELSTDNEIWKELTLSRRETQQDFADIFYEYCMRAIIYDEGDEYGRTNNPKWLTTQLHKKDNGDCIFTNENNRDFKEFSGFNFGLRKISDLINETLENKTLLKCKIVKINNKSKPSRVVYIKKEYFKEKKK